MHDLAKNIGVIEPTQQNLFGVCLEACRKNVEIGRGDVSPSKKMAVRGRLRIPGEETFGAWTGRCVLNPSGRYEKTALQAKYYTATPMTQRAGYVETGFQFFFGKTCLKPTGPIRLKSRIKKHYIYKLSININAKYVEQKGSMIMKSAVLRVVVNYEGTKFYTKDEKGYFKQHEALEDARMYLIYKYGADTVIKVETFVRFSY